MASQDSWWWKHRVTDGATRLNCQIKWMPGINPVYCKHQRRSTQISNGDNTTQYIPLCSDNRTGFRFFISQHKGREYMFKMAANEMYETCAMQLLFYNQNVQLQRHTSFFVVNCHHAAHCGSYFSRCYRIKSSASLHWHRIWVCVSVCVCPGHGSSRTRRAMFPVSTVPAHPESIQTLPGAEAPGTGILWKSHAGPAQEERSVQPKVTKPV